jgi:hypothetical protein
MNFTGRLCAPLPESSSGANDSVDLLQSRSSCALRAVGSYRVPYAQAIDLCRSTRYVMICMDSAFSLAKTAGYPKPDLSFATDTCTRVQSSREAAYTLTGDCVAQVK